jgi:hypothetical protein
MAHSRRDAISSAVLVELAARSTMARAADCSWLKEQLASNQAQLADLIGEWHRRADKNIRRTKEDGAYSDFLASRFWNSQEYQNDLQRENVMIASIKAVEKITVRGLAAAAVVTALLAASGAAQAADSMPANCAQNLDRCSQKVWGHNAFSHSGDTRSTTFSNGKTLTCTSHGKDTPRGCTLQWNWS